MVWNLYGRTKGMGPIGFVRQGFRTIAKMDMVHFHGGRNDILGDYFDRDIIRQKKNSRLSAPDNPA